MARRFVERYGWTAFAGLTSLVWALPLVAWAGAVDFAPDAFFAAFFAACLFPAWVFVAWRARRWRVPGSYRWDPAQMSRPELLWGALAALAAIGVIGWLNAALTVDWGILGPGLSAGRPGIWAFVAVALAALAGCAAATAVCWRRAAAAYRLRSGVAIAGPFPPAAGGGREAGVVETISGA